MKSGNKLHSSQNGQTSSKKIQKNHHPLMETSEGEAFARYRESIDVLLKAAQEEYAQASLVRRTMQYALLRNYLWLATVIFAGNGTLLVWLANPDTAPVRHIFPNPCGISFALLISALILAFVAFICGMDAARGRGAMMRPYGKPFGDLARMAYEDPCWGDVFMKYEMLVSLSAAIERHLRDVNARGKMARAVCCMLLVSAGCGIAACAVEAVRHFFFS